MSELHTTPPSAVNPWLRMSALLPVAALTVTACSGEQNNAPESRSAVPPVSTIAPTPSSMELSTSASATASPSSTELSPSTSANKECLSSVLVSPGAAFNEANSDSIQKQLDTLAKTQNKEKVTASDFLQATAAYTNSTRDPVFANAFEYAIDHRSTSSAEDLLDRKAEFTEGTTDCFTKEQFRQSYDIGKAYLLGLGPKSGRQISATGEYLYQVLREDFNDFARKYGLPELPA